ncbi:MAG: hypothetical protein RR415_10965 [Ruthenibacterium sp.]
MGIDTSLITAANLVVAELADCNAVLSLAPDFELPRLVNRQVVVVPFGKESSIIGKATVEYVFEIQIGVLRRAKPDEVADLIALSETIGQRLLNKKLGKLFCFEVSWDPVYSADDLRSKNQFTSVIDVKLKVIKGA